MAGRGNGSNIAGLGGWGRGNGDFSHNPLRIGDDGAFEKRQPNLCTQAK